MRNSNNVFGMAREDGAALVTVLIAGILLGTACIAMLSAVGASSKNNTDALTEAKAYWAAESGLQATINLVRNDPEVTYRYADTNPTLASKLTYATVNGISQVAVGTEAGYSVSVIDPDNSEDRTIFSTLGRFSANETNSITYPIGAVTGARTTLTISEVTNSTINYLSGYADPQIAVFNVSHAIEGPAHINNGAPVNFRIVYGITTPRSASRVMYGQITQPTAGGPITATFSSQHYKLIGSEIELCSSSNTTIDAPQSCASVTFNLDQADPQELYVNASPVPPYRLKVLSTGFGPNSSKKQLEGMIQRNLFNGLGSGAATSMIGTNCVPSAAPLNHCYQPGNSSGVNYNGGNCETTGCVPTFGLTNPDYLAYVLANPPGGGAGNPAQYDAGLPQMLNPTEVPEWQSSPAALDVVIDEARIRAEGSGRYFVSPGGNLNNPGIAGSSGITFCEGSCTVGGTGGGTLIVTGKLTSLGGFVFNGLIIVTGEEGWERAGGGGGTITGSVVIAPYNRRTYVPENLSSTFLPPRYWINGGGASDIIYADVSSTFDELSSISDFMLGVAEK